jgi:hypothetical protein
MFKTLVERLRYAQRPNALETAKCPKKLPRILFLVAWRLTEVIAN